MHGIDCFAADYTDARSRFLAAATAAGAAVATYPHPLRGPDGGELATDVAMLGDSGAERVLLANSATHGVEGFCGSGALVGWLRDEKERSLPPGVRVVLVHAINPHGFAWLCRVTEDNVDLNRNFVDFAGKPPVNAAYAGLHAAILPAAWDDASCAERERIFAEFRAAHGAPALQQAITGGQYSHADGLFFGGREPGWSNRTFHQILADHVMPARHVGFIDFHTGLGPYGTAELITNGRRGHAGYDRAVEWYRNGVVSVESGDSASAPLTGTIDGAVDEGLPGVEVTGIAAEFGTYPLTEVLDALMADLWLHQRGRRDSKQGRAIKAAIRRAFYPDEDDWKELVWIRSRQVLRRAIDGLRSAGG